MNQREAFAAAVEVRNGASEILSTGWPDLFVKRANGLWTAVEVKAGIRDRPKSNQLDIHEALREAGVAVEVAYVQPTGVVYHAGMFHPGGDYVYLPEPVCRSCPLSRYDATAQEPNG